MAAHCALCPCIFDSLSREVMSAVRFVAIAKVSENLTGSCLLLQFLTLLCYIDPKRHNAQCYSRTDGQTDGRHYDAKSRSYCVQYDRLKGKVFPDEPLRHRAYMYCNFYTYCRSIYDRYTAKMHILFYIRIIFLNILPHQ